MRRKSIVIRIILKCFVTERWWILSIYVWTSSLCRSWWCSCGDLLLILVSDVNDISIIFSSIIALMGEPTPFQWVRWHKEVLERIMGIPSLFLTEFKRTRWLIVAWRLRLYKCRVRVVLVQKVQTISAFWGSSESATKSLPITNTTSRSTNRVE